MQHSFVYCKLVPSMCNIHSHDDIIG